MTKKREEKELDQAIEEIKKRFGEAAVVKLSKMRAADVKAISTGSISLDLALGVGGVPRGRITEIFGAEASGKTTLALHILSEAQKVGGVGAFIDAEHALDADYAGMIGVDVGELLISQPSSGEQALQIVESLVKSSVVDVIVIDSVAALTPRAEIDGEIGDFQIGLQARIMSQACRKLASIISKTETAVIFLNQTRMKIQAYGNPETTTGGLALKFYSSVRINLKKRAKIRLGDKIVGNRIEAKIVKNKVAPPFRRAEFDIYYNEGISWTADLVRTGVKYGIIRQTGSWYNFEDRKIGQGMEKTKEELRKDKSLAKKIKEKIIERIKEIKGKGE